jgi:7-cyano-7-deazaguanine synthase in queuosine biosynthesis
MEAKLEVIQYGGDDYEATMYNTWVTAVSIAGGTDSTVVGEIIVDQMATVNGLYLSYGPQTVTITTYKA